MGKRKRNKIFFVGICICIMLAVIIFLAQAVVKKHNNVEGDTDANEEVLKLQISNGKTEETSEGRKNSMERYLDVVDPEKRTKDYITESARYSRELSAEEQSRYQDFQDRYEEDGLAPKAEIEIVDKMEDYGKEVDSPVYAIWEVEYFLPERTLTDEDLLQMVDLGFKVNYALQKKQEEIKKAAENSSGKVTEQEAIEKAVSVVEKMFHIDTSSMEKETQYNGVDTYFVFIGEKMEVFIEVATGAVISVTPDRAYVPEVENAVEVNRDFEKMYYSNYEKVKTFLSSILDPNVEIVSSSCRYKTDQTGSRIPEGVIGYIDYYFKMADETVYKINYDMIEKRMERLVREEKGYTQYKTKEELEKEGTQKIGDKFIVPLTGAEKEAYGEEDTQWMVVPME